MNIQPLQEIALDAKSRGWQLLIVGGFVRDQILGIESKDIDCEVYGVPDVDTLIEWLSLYGDVNAVGASFGVLKLTIDDVDFDISLPRRENKQGQGHKGFIVEPDPTMTPREAAQRRDFTMNAMALDPVSGELFDFFGGRQDLEHGILRHTSEAFSEDPLRVLRGFQFCGRFSMTATDETLDLCFDLVDEVDFLALERVWTEWEKWAIKSERPFHGLRFLRMSDWLGLYPELFNLQGVEQCPDHHPEGNAWVHTLCVVEAMHLLCERERITDEDRVVLMFAALLHDVGKVGTTEFNEGKGHITSYGHDQAGGPLAASFLGSIGAPKAIIERVVPLVMNHMRHINYHTGGKPCAKHARRLARDLHPATVQEWAFLVEADHSGRPPLPGGLPDAAAELLRIADEVAVRDAAPKSPLMGRHLIEMRMTPGVEFGVILKAADEAFVEGEFQTVDEGKAWVTQTENAK